MSDLDKLVDEFDEPDIGLSELDYESELIYLDDIDESIDFLDEDELIAIYDEQVLVENWLVSLDDEDYGYNG